MKRARGTRERTLQQYVHEPLPCQAGSPGQWRQIDDVFSLNVAGTTLNQAAKPNAPQTGGFGNRTDGR